MNVLTFLTLRTKMSLTEKVLKAMFNCTCNANFTDIGSNNMIRNKKFSGQNFLDFISVVNEYFNLDLNLEFYGTELQQF